MKIVVLDGSSTVRKKIEDLLLDMDFDELDIDLFENGEEALDFIRLNGADLIFSSIETKGMDGVTFVDHIIRENENYISKLFVVTSHKSGEHFEDIKDIGAKRFIKKPINEEHFKHFVIPEIRKVLKS